MTDDKELDPLARRELRLAHKQIGDCMEHLVSARAAMLRAMGKGGPNLIPKLDNLIGGAEGLIQAIDHTAPAFEPHSAHRGEVPARPKPITDTLPEHHSKR